ncbi:MAG: tetratricopeptide repeat protein [Bacteroidetes bacterium]|nr:tetratricopeptide repeat protein [Bacteroidota bacterium]
MRTQRPILAALAATALYLLPSVANAQDTGQSESPKYYSLYYEDFKNKNYESALPSLRWILQNDPAFPQNSDRNFERAVETYREIAIQQSSDAERQAYLDSALAIFDTAVPKLQDIGAKVDEFEWTLERGKFIFENREFLPELEPEIATQYRKAFEMDPSRLDPYYLEYILADMVQNQEDKQAAVDFLNEIEAARGEEPAIQDLLKKWRGALFTSPEERYDFLRSQLENDPDNLELLNEVMQLAQDLEYRDVVYEIGDRLLAVEPTAKVLRTLAQMKTSDGDYEGALDLLDQALGMATDDVDRRDIYFNMGIAEQQLGRLSKARTNFRQAIDLDSSFGRAFMAIGDLYVTAIANCGSFDRRDRAVYWLVVDYYTRAKNADSSLASQANTRINQYSKYFPEAEDKFFMKWNTGESYRVDEGCYSWINETTTVK